MSRSYLPAERDCIVEHILEEIAKGRSVSRILAEDDAMCSYAQWSIWQRESVELKAKVADAREEGATKLVEEIVTISDERNGDARIEYRDGQPVAVIDGDTVQRAKLRVYAREKYAAMIAPRRFGQRLDVTSGGEKLPAPQPALVLDNRVNALVLLASQRKAQGTVMIDVTPDPDPLDDIMQ